MESDAVTAVSETPREADQTTSVFAPLLTNISAQLDDITFTAEALTPIFGEIAFLAVTGTVTFFAVEFVNENTSYLDVPTNGRNTLFLKFIVASPSLLLFVPFWVVTIDVTPTVQQTILVGGLLASYAVAYSINKSLREWLWSQ